MLPGCSTSLTALFHGCGSHLKLLECVVDGTGGRVRSTTPAEDRYIVLSTKRNRRTTAQRVANQLFASPQESRSPENCCQTFEGRRTIHTQTCCVCPIDQTAPYCPFAMVSSITIGLNRLGMRTILK
ncbi:hypothetical protein TNCV_901861 [Trichonephila clavipes]|nr:hypothetical protein TNCV_901861 [Trichonephila clavipes]